MCAILSDINWLGMIIGAVLAFVFGGCWYNPKGMGARWMAAQGKTAEDFKGHSPAAPLTVQAIATLLLAFLIAAFATFGAGAFVFLTLVLIAVMLLSMLGGVMFEMKSITLWWINAVHEGIVILIMAACVWWI